MKKKIINRSHNVGYVALETRQGEPIERKCARLTENNEPITDGAPVMYFPKKEGVRPETNIRTDKWEIAQEAMNRVNREKIAKGIQLENMAEEGKEKGQEKTTDGGTTTEK